ncbi:MAG: flagellar hook-associated protein FlgK [Vampirovibrionales bacterium]|nr:flagellar hook-associated protein FlgK [Vampirovibrionales bacterium]
MITPAFFGFYNAHRSMLTAQAALSTINHNISNANTEGYSRQRVEITAADPYWAPNNYQLTGGQVGQGSVVDKIIRARDVFLDTQYQNESSGLGLASGANTILKQLEGIIGEPSDQGVNAALQKFFDSAQELSVNPESIPVRANFIQTATDLLTVFQQQAAQLYDLRSNIAGTPGASGTFATSQMGLMTNQINNKFDEIAALNRQIVTIKASGAEPNDLYDKRDQLLDELSKLIDIKVDRFDNGQINVSIADGNVLAVRSADVLERLTYTMNAGPAPDPFNVPGLLQTTSGQTLNDFTGNEIQGGQMKALIDMGQYNAADPTKTNVRSVLSNLNTLFTNIASQVNTLQSTGRDLSGAVNGLDFYETGAANPPGDPIQLLSWQVNSQFQDVANGPGRLAAAIDDPAAAGPPAGWAGVGDGRNALALAQLRNQAIAGLGSASFVEYHNALTSNLGIASSTYGGRAISQQTLLNNLDQQRQSVSGVNTDEEMIDMLRFQRMFESSSKMISVFDDIYKTIINLS